MACKAFALTLRASMQHCNLGQQPNVVRKLVSGARLSRAFAPPEGTTFLRGEVAAILQWRREDGDEDYHYLLRRDAWEVVLPELVFESPQ